MVILFLNDTMGTGGKERRMLELIKSLVLQKDYKIILLSLSEDVGYDYIKDLPIEFITIKKSKISVKPFVVIRDVIKKYNPQIIHSWGSLSSLYLIPFIALSKRKFINGFLADAPLNLGLSDKHYLRGKLTFPFSDVILSNSKAGIAAYKAPASKSICIYNGMDFKRFSGLKDPDQLKTEIFGKPFENLFIVGMVAAFEDRKDYRTLILAALQLLKNHPDLRFLLIGAGSQMDEMKQMVPADLKDKIIFLGKRNDVESLIQIFDIGVLLTNSKVHGEGVSNSIIEYMALGKPVIATTGGGTNEVIFDNENGMLVEAENPDQLVSKIEILIADKELAGKMAKNGHEMVVEKFNSTNMAQNYINVYNSLIS